MSTNALTKSGEFFPSVFDDFFSPWNEWFDTGGRVSKLMKVPAVNVTENNNEYKVSLATPGLKKADFKIGIQGNMITISSEKEENKDENNARYTRKEYSYSSFSRSFTLPDDVKQEAIEASYEDGVLHITLPKKEETKNTIVSKQIAVK